MVFLPYTNNIPFPTNSPSADQPNMLDNTNSIQTLIAVDHLGFETLNGGYHNDIHFNPQITDPGKILNIGQLYTKSVTFNSVTDVGLFYENGAGVVVQLDSPANTSALPNGYTFLPGGIILQWGFATIDPPNPGKSSTPVIFPTPFLLNIFAVIAQPYTGALGNVPLTTYTTNSQSLTGFNFFINNPNGISSFNWIAIGN
jgi:hypothetical protein